MVRWTNSKMQVLQQVADDIKKRIVMRNKSVFWIDAEYLEALFFVLVAMPENGKVNGALDAWHL